MNLNIRHIVYVTGSPFLQRATKKIVFKVQYFYSDFTNEMAASGLLAES